MAAPKAGKLQIPPGLVLTESLEDSVGRWIDADHVRFVRGQPEKIGGWNKYSTSGMVGVARGSWTWNDLSAASWVAIGTHRKLYAVDNNKTPYNITPFASSVTLVDKLSTTSGFGQFSVRLVAHGVILDQGIHLEGTGSLGGIVITGDYTVSAVTDADNFIVSVIGMTAATSSVALGGGSVVMGIEIVAGPVDPVVSTGYGTGTYGMSTYGTPRVLSSTIVLEARSWSFGNMGRILIATVSNGQMYSWDPSTSPRPRATLITGTDLPGAVRGAFVTAERFVVAYGASTDTSIAIDTMRIRWCDQSDHTYWDAGVDGHTSNDRRLTEGKRLIAGTPFVNRTSLIWSDSALYLMQYTGSEFVYDTRPVGYECGLIGPSAFVIVDNAAYWMGESSFFMFNGSVSRIPGSDDMADWLYPRINRLMSIKNFAFYIPRFNEVWWFYVGQPDDRLVDSVNRFDEPCYYVAVRLDDHTWTKGTLQRTAGVRIKGDAVNPLLYDNTSGYLYEHEVGLDQTGESIPSIVDAWIQSGPVQIDDGNEDMDLFGYYPNFSRQAKPLQMTLQTRDSAPEPVQETVITNIPARTGAIDLHMSGRMISLKIRSNVIGGDFALGTLKFETRIAGGRRP